MAGQWRGLKQFSLVFLHKTAALFLMVALCLSALICRANPPHNPTSEMDLDDVGTFWAEQFLNNVHPAIVGVSRAVSDSGVGRMTRQTYRETIAYWSPIVADQIRYAHHYWSAETPNLYRWLRNVPAPIKIQVDHFETAALHYIVTHRSQYERSSLPASFRDLVEALSNMMQPSHNQGQQLRMNRLLSHIRPYNDDPGMRDCYHIQLLESDAVNAFNTGCTIYITTGIAGALNDNELTAVMAHEMSHGDQGHLVKNMGMFLAAVGNHALKLMGDELVWFFTDRMGQTLNDVTDGGNLPLIFRTYADEAPAVEIAADQGGAMILHRYGLPRETLKNALISLHRISYGTDEGSDPDAHEGAVRNYPGLAERLRAIDAVRF